MMVTAAPSGRSIFWSGKTATFRTCAEMVRMAEAYHLRALCRPPGSAGGAGARGVASATRERARSRRPR
jgi:hypothetical protein